MAGKIFRCADASCRHDRQPERPQFLEQRLGASAAGMPTGALVDGNQSVRAAIDGLAGPARLGHVVVNDAAGRMHALAYPPRIPERCDEESQAFLQRHVDPLAHAGQIGAAAGFDQRVEADGPRRERANLTQSGAQFVAMHVGKGDRLDHPESARFADGSDQFRV